MPDEKLITLEPYALLYTRAGAGVCLRDPLTGKAGVIFMELADGMALERSLNGERPVRPDTSSLLSHFLSAMECRVRLVLINGRKDEVFTPAWRWRPPTRSWTSWWSWTPARRTP
ncbi:bifunctional nuclease domain-containing protein [Akkermansia massiliensis]